MPTFTHSGCRVWYEVIGEGPSVLFCHGLGGDSRQVVELLGEIPRHQLVVWDARAHGLTDENWPAARLDFPTLAGDLKALFDHLSLRTGVIGGVSMGAGVAAAFGRLWPQLTSGLIMIRPAWIERAHTSNLRLFPMLARALENGIEAARQAIENTPEFRRLRENSPGAAVSILQQLEKPRARERRRRLFEMPDSCPVESWEQISTFPHPALVIGTHDDPIHPYEFAEAWARRIRGARLAEVPPKWPRANDHSLAVRQKVGAFLRFLNECGVAEAIAGR